MPEFLMLVRFHEPSRHDFVNLPRQNEVLLVHIDRLIIDPVVCSGPPTVIWSSLDMCWADIDEPEDRINHTSRRGQSGIKVVETNGQAAFCEAFKHWCCSVVTVRGIADSNQSNLQTSCFICGELFARILIPSRFTIGENDCPLISVRIESSSHDVIFPHSQTDAHGFLKIS